MPVLSSPSSSLALSPRSIGMLSTFPPRLCGLATFAEALCQAFERSGRHVVRVPVTTGHAPDGHVGSHRDTAASVQAEILSRCDVAVVQHEFGIFRGPDGDKVLEVLAALTVPSVVVLHSVPARPTDHQRLVLEEVCAAASRVVVMAHAAEDHLLATYDVDPASVVMVPHGATLPAHRASHQSGPGDPLQLLTWGLLGPGKGIEHVISALALLDDLRPAVRYTVAGATHPNVYARDGDLYRHTLSRRAQTLGVGSSVVFDVRYRDVATLMQFVQSSSVVVLPYDSSDQATSGVLVDAIAAGRPVIATAFPHAVEMLSGGAGIIVPHRDPAAIAAAVRSLVSDPEHLAEMTATARALAPGLSWDAVASRYLGLCQDLAAGVGATTGAS